MFGSLINRSVRYMPNPVDLAYEINDLKLYTIKKKAQVSLRQRAQSYVHRQDWSHCLLQLQSCLQLMSHPLSHQYLLIQQSSHWPLLCPGCSLAPAHTPSAGSELKAPSSKALDEFLWPGYTFQTGTKGEFQEPRKAERGCLQTLRKNRQDSWSAGGDIQLWSKTTESEEGLSPPPPGLPDLAGDTDIIWTRKETSQLLKKTWAGWLEPEHTGRRNEKLENEAGRCIMCNAFSCRTAKAVFREGGRPCSKWASPSFQNHKEWTIPSPSKNS